MIDKSCIKFPIRSVSQLVLYINSPPNDQQPIVDHNGSVTNGRTEGRTACSIHSTTGTFEARKTC